MNNQEFIDELSCRLKYSDKDVSSLVASLIDMMSQEWQEGSLLTVQDFGMFDVVKHLEHIEVNPVTKQRVLVPPELCLDYTPDPAWEQELRNASPDE